MDTLIKLLEVVSTIMEKLTLQKIILTLSFGITMITILYMYDHREKIMNQIINDQFSRELIAAGTIVFILVWIFTLLINKVNAKNDEYIKSLESHLEETNKQYKDLLDKAITYQGPKRRNYDSK